ncbi:universal stress protein [Haloglomus litoreum]|uniref:universal stress protein n=1 Tax=Haloglomus litoreum TaxID=3034026 RepID=UPI0023E7AEF4|nr:universal stress protein [Haloglomus sp. DT116]
MTLLGHPLVPVADAADAAATAAALERRLDGTRRITVLHVVEKGGGAVDKAPMARRVADADAFLSTVERRLGDAVPVETRVEFGRNVADTIVATALDVDATAIAFRPRGGSRLVRFLSGDTASRLLTGLELPVVSLPAAGGAGPAPTPDKSADAGGDREVRG